MGAAPGCSLPGGGKAAGQPRRGTHLARVPVWHMTAVARETCTWARLVPLEYTVAEVGFSLPNTGLAASETSMPMVLTGCQLTLLFPPSRAGASSRERQVAALSHLTRWCSMGQTLRVRPGPR
jgi:hypothetical protein